MDDGERREALHVVRELFQFRLLVDRQHRRAVAAAIAAAVRSSAAAGSVAPAEASASAQTAQAAREAARATGLSLLLWLEAGLRRIGADLLVQRPGAGEVRLRERGSR